MTLYHRRPQGRNPSEALDTTREQSIFQPAMSPWSGAVNSRPPMILLFFPPPSAVKRWRRTPSKPRKNTTESGLGKPPAETNTDRATPGRWAQSLGPVPLLHGTPRDFNQPACRLTLREPLAVSACLSSTSLSSSTAQRRPHAGRWEPQIRMHHFGTQARPRYFRKRVSFCSDQLMPTGYLSYAT